MSRTLRRSLRVLAVTAASLAMLLGAAAAPAHAGASPARHGSVDHPDADHAGAGLAPATASAATAARLAASGQTSGMDVSSHQGNVDWAGAWRAGARFAYVKATEGTGYTNPYFAQQYNGSYGVGMIHGAYHFALPDRSGAVAQADFFVAHGGRWSADGRTLPPALDIEYNPYGATCYGLGPAAMVAWIRAFVREVRARAGRNPSIYTTTDWWTTCTGGKRGFGATDALWVARYAASPGTLPGDWPTWRIWQYAAAGTLPGDQDVFHGNPKQLRRFALGR